MDAERLQRLHEVFGPLSHAEKEYLIGIIRLLDSAIEQHRSFKDVVGMVMDDIRRLLRYRLNVDQALTAGERLHALTEEFSSNGKIEPLTAKEVKALEDTIKMIEFAIRNGVGFFFPLEIISHDFGEYERYAYDLEDENLGWFSPKATGWADLDEDAFGETGT